MVLRAARRVDRRPVLRSHARGKLRPRPAAVPHPTQGDQGRVIPLRRHLLPALPARREAPSDDRHRNEPYRLPLRPSGKLMLENWNDTPTRAAIVDFVERVTTDGG